MAGKPGAPAAAQRRAALIRATLERRDPGHRAGAAGSAAGRLVAPPIGRRATGGPAPLSFAQERLWFLERLGGTGGAYNSSLALRLDGELSVAALSRALDELGRRHEALRTRFEERENQPVQVVDPPRGPLLGRVDLGALPPARREETLRGLAREVMGRPFDLSRGPLFRAVLLRREPAAHVLVLALHHIVFDGWSIGVLVGELGALYGAFAAGLASPLPELELQYADYAVWQRRWLEGEVLEHELSFWRGLLDGAPEELALPTVRPRPPVQSHRGATEAFRWPAALGASVDGLARGAGGTPFMVLLTGWAALLARYSGQPDLTIGTPIANRHRLELEPLIGFFANTLVLRVDLRDRPSFAAAVRRLKEVALDAYEHQELPFEKLVAELRPRRNLARTPLFQVLFTLQNTGAELPRFPGVGVERLSLATATARFELELALVQRGEELFGQLTYNRDLFDAVTARRMVRHLRSLLEAAAESPEHPVLELPLLSAAERHQLLLEWGGAAAPAPATALPTLPAAFEAQVDRTPDAPAASGGGVSYSYRELDRRANRIARRLRRAGVGPEVPVAVLLERTGELPAVLLGIHKAGGAYVPLDPAHPAERLRVTLEAVRAGAGHAVLVTDRHGAGAVPSWRGPTLDLDAESEELSALDPGRLGVEIDLRSLAYAIFTSGSTGRPKGVEVPHGALASFLAAMARQPGLGPGDVLAAVTTPAFDIAALELFLPLVTGARVVVADRETAADAGRLAAFLAEHGATALQATPATWSMLLECGWPGDPGLRALCGGEAMPPELAAALRPWVAALWNLYGPTETTVWSTVERLGEPDGAGTVSIGRAIAETAVQVLDAALRPVPAGVYGELWIGGAGVARGYLGQPGLTAERFAPSPGGSGAGGPPGARAYRTGDLGRFRADGRLELLGRLDHQVKIRGFRIELGEVEAALGRHPGVARAVATAREDRPGDRRLVAYLVPRDPGVEAEELRRFLRDLLPDYMVPAAFVLLERLPLGASGKVDRRALPAPEWSSRGAKTAPRDEVERRLAAIWSELLAVPAERLGLEDDFFELGGHSLLATRMVSRLRTAFGTEVPLRRVLEAPTLAGVKGSLLEAALGDLEALAPAPEPPAPAAGGARARTGPLSFAQERLWFLHRMGAAGDAYNLSLALHVGGELDAAALARAIAGVVGRHEPLRTRFDLVEGRPVQVIEAGARARPVTVDLSRLEGPAPSPAERPGAHRPSGPDGWSARAEAEVRRQVASAARHPFDLARAPLLRPLLLRLGARDHVLVLTVHHIVSDGWSTGVLVRELAALYRESVTGLAAALPEISFHYADVALWQRGRLAGPELERLLGFWRRKLQGMPEELELPTDRPYPPLQTHRGGVVPFAVGPALCGPLERLARTERGTLFMVLLTAFSALLSRYTGQRDLAVGTPIAGRNRAETEPLIGFFVNTLALRSDLSGDPTFREALRRLRAFTLDAFSHQDLPFEKLVAELRPRRNLARSPLVQVLFVLQNLPAEEPRFHGLETRVLASGSAAARFELELVFAPREGGLAGHLIYNRDLFDAATARRMKGHLETLLAAVAAAPETPLSRLPILGAAERHQLLLEVNDSGDSGAPEAELPLHRWIEAQAARTPEATALVFEGGHLSYAELAERAGRLARHLRRRGVGPEARVGVAAERSLELVVALLAVLEAGGAYVPLDPSYPAERLAFMLADSGTRWLLVQGRLLASLPPVPEGVEVLDLDERPEPWAGESTQPAELAGDAVPENVAYTIYTSGSTGRPKGAMNSHRAIVNRLVWMQRAFGLGPGDRVLQKTPASFDVSVWELFWPLMTGACLVMARPEGHKDSAYLARLVEREGITTLHFVPSMLQVFLGERDLALCRGLRRVITSGEALPAELAKRFFERLPEPVELHNLYGPTEAAVDVTWWPCDRRSPRRAIPIGRPIANVTIQVVDADLQPQPAGVPGEVVIGGVALARGYLGRPGLTAERFVPDRSAGSADGGARIYRTGDLARRLPDGEVEFLGRLDHQVKVRGFRIELGEIEARLLEHPAVAEAVVVARQDGRGEPALIAYAVAAAGARPQAADLREHLRRALPEPMVPAAFVVLDELPLNPSGKVDRRALPAPEAAPAAAGEAPRTALERTVAAVWCGVLGREAVATGDNFFDLGGHSLLLVEVQRRLEQELGRPLEVVELFRHPTVGALARALAGEAPDAEVEAPAAVPGPGRRPEIAVVGMAGRFPGAGDLGAFWRLLEEGREGVRVLSDDELRRSGVAEEQWSAPGYVRARGVLDGAETFDAAFFDYSPREAQVMDPQQRVFLEAAWEALEHAGYDSRRAGGRVGVFAGAGMNTYLLNLLAHPDVTDAVGAYQVAIANKHDTLPTRVSYKLDLKGPSVNVQTACSTSLVAVHMACRSLLDGECDLALAGGVAVSGTPTAGYRYQPGGIASPDGHCRAFDAAARGTVVGDGVGVVVLKRLADALADRDTVHAVVLGTAINNDGAVKQGFTAPSVDGQAAVVARAQAVAGVAADSITYVEAHGTGTELGDPIEVAALAQVFRPADGSAPVPERCALGSVKTNVGHLDAAAGVAGLIKTILALEHRRIPPSLHFERPNPKIPFAGSPFRVAAEAVEWPAAGGPRRAGVSSFGIGGTNAHAVLEEAPTPPPPGPSRPWQLLVLSARTEPALEEASRRLADHLRARPEQPLADVAYTLQVGRRPWGARRALVCRHPEEAVAALDGRDPGGLLSGRAAGARGQADGGGPGVVFLFPGQGAQHPGMAAELYRREEVFREAFDRCAEELAPELGVDLRRVLFDDAAADRLRETWLAQPALFAVEHSLARLWRSWGIEPAAMLGHSVGEYAAACLAGVLSLSDALAVVAARGRLMQSMPPGEMLALSAGEEGVFRLLAGRDRPGSELSVAAVNGPEAVVVSGPAAAMAELRALLAESGIDFRPVHTSHAFHSAAMDPVLEPFAERLRQVELRPPRIPFVSNLTGTWITAEQATDPGYWARQLRGTVRFAAGLSTLLETPGRALLEVGPGRTLATLARRHPGREAAREIVHSLPHPKTADSEQAFLLATLARLWLTGVEVDWDGFRGAEERRRVPLPTYPFERRPYWVGRAGRGREPAPLAAEVAAPEELPSAVGGLPRTTLYAAPRSELERAVAAAWQELLGSERIGVHDDFFELGGSSLLALRLTAGLRERVGVELDPHALLAAPTVAGLAAKLAAAGTPAGRGTARRAPGGSSLLVEVRPGDPSVPPLFLVHPAGGHVYRFRALGRGLAEAGFPGPVLALRALGLEDGEEPLASVEEMARHYLAEVRRAYPLPPGGAYHLAGSSMGGMVAFEMARLLRRAGEEMGLVALLDTFGPGQMPEALRQREPGAIEDRAAPGADPG
ncbi:MAG TPA: amino acid adenylation domain-containing protein, partial [Thermoanaerobaculia bacterium]|nr:amino acid adenylation domain-containing protein [Thermoanaerobaculia bacterium]